MVAVVSLLGVLLYPHGADLLLVHQLGSDEAEVRERAILEAVARAKDTPRTLRYLNWALDTDNDARFSGAASALVRLGKFDIPDRDPLQLDRMTAHQVAATRSEVDPATAAEVRLIYLNRAILTARDNKYTRRTLSGAAGDPAAAVRARSALLAIRLHDDDTVAELLDDADAEVRGAAAVDAALAKRDALTGRIRAMLAEETDPRAAGSAAYALALLDAEASSPAICERLAAAGNPILRDRLLHVMTVLADQHARRAVLKLLRAASKPGEHPPVAALVAAAKLKIRQVAPYVRQVLAAASRPSSKVLRAHVRAALDAANAMDLPVRKEVNELCRAWWGPRNTLLLVSAAETLGRQILVDQSGRPDAPTVAECRRTLEEAVTYPRDALPAKPGEPKPVPTPLPSAAAAVALWRLKPTALAIVPASLPVAGLTVLKPDPASGAWWVIRAAGAAGGQVLPADYIAWHLGRTGRGEAFELGAALLPRPLSTDTPASAQEPRVYNEQARCAGAMLMALSARTDRQKARAIERIAARLDALESDRFTELTTYRCALLLLGRREYVKSVRDDLTKRTHLLQRVLTALFGAGERLAPDWLLWSPAMKTSGIAYILTYGMVDDVVAAAAPDLPGVDPAGNRDLRLWQAMILRDTYAIRREQIKTGFPW